MRQIALLVAVSALLVGCGRGIAQLDKLDRVQSAVLTDAHALSPATGAAIAPPVQITDPDQLIALQKFMESLQPHWKPLRGTPRPTRYQLELNGGGGPLYTLWIEPGYIAMASGKTLQESRLSNAQTAELLACIGLPPGALQMASASEFQGTPNYGIADKPQQPRGNIKKDQATRTVEYTVPAEE